MMDVHLVCLCSSPLGRFRSWRASSISFCIQSLKLCSWFHLLAEIQWDQQMPNLPALFSTSDTTVTAHLIRIRRIRSVFIWHEMFILCMSVSCRLKFRSDRVGRGEQGNMRSGLLLLYFTLVQMAGAAFPEDTEPITISHGNCESLSFHCSLLPSFLPLPASVKLDLVPDCKWVSVRSKLCFPPARRLNFVLFCFLFTFYYYLNVKHIVLF